MKIKLKFRFIMYLFIIIVGGVLIVISTMLNKSDNSKENQTILDYKEVYQSNPGSGLRSTITLQGESWENSSTHFDEPGVEPYKLNYIANQYNMMIENTSSTRITQYQFKFTADQKMHLVTIWSNRVIEVHQFRNGKEIIETIDLENVRDDLTLDHVYTDKPLVTLDKGDYFIYTAKGNGWEVPLGTDQSSNKCYPGFIVFKQIDMPEINPQIDFIYPEYSPKESNIMFSMQSRKDVHGKPIDSDDGHPNYVMDTFDIKINNKTDKLISSYYFKMIVKEKMYLDNMWDGAIEIHQNVKNNEVVQIIKNMVDLKSLVSNNELKLEYITNDADVYITLYEGDYIIYNPLKERRSITSNQVINNGFIMVYQNNGSVPKIDIEFTYLIISSIVKYPTFWIGIGLIASILIVLAFEAIMQYRLKKYIVQKTHDEKIIVEAIETFTSFIDAKDPYTKGHSNRVSEYSRDIARALNLPEEECQKIYYIALMHDCGKIGIPDNILTKPGRLTSDEYNIIKTHTTIGYEILKNFTSIDGIRDGALYHHERYDGKGYPQGLRGEDIPLIARIICVADSFDAMTSNRCYRNALSKEQVIKELINNKGTQFDPNIIDVFLKLINDGKIVI